METPSYVAGGDEYLYPALGDPKPPGGAKVIVLTRGGTASQGPWQDDGFCVGWARLPKRNHEREKLLPGHHGVMGYYQPTVYTDGQPHTQQGILPACSSSDTSPATSSASSTPELSVGG